MAKPAVAIQPVSRSLRVLAALNARASTTVDELYRDTGYPKSSLMRLLGALMADGYVEQVSRSAGYRLTERVLSLSSGFRPRDRVVDIAIPLFREFTAQYEWPVHLGMLEDFVMWVRASSTAESPIAPDPSAVFNVPLSVLPSALGKAYLAFCPAQERELILEALVQSPNPQDAVARDQQAVEALLAPVRRSGYATTGPLIGDRGRGIAVPVRAWDRVVACVTMRLYKSSMSEAEAVRRYLEPLQGLADTIGRECEAAPDAAKTQQDKDWSPA